MNFTRFLLVLTICVNQFLISVAVFAQDNATRGGKASYSCQEIVANELLIKLKDKDTNPKLINKNINYIRLFQRPQTLSKKHIDKNLQKIYTERNSKIKRLKEKYKIDNYYLAKFNNYSCEELHRELIRLKANIHVEDVQFNHKLKIQSRFDDRFLISNGDEWSLPYSEVWGLKQIKADKVWDQVTGNGVVVALIDTGVDYNHPDLWSNIWVNPDTVVDRDNNGRIDLNDLDFNNNHLIETEELNIDLDRDGKLDNVLGFDTSLNRDNNPMDYLGHGTHLAGIIAASAGNQIGLVGVAPKAKILPLKAFADETFSAYEADLADAILMALEIYSNSPEIKRMVTNSSWGVMGVYNELPLVGTALKLAENGGVINIAAAGNDGHDLKDGEFYPAAYSSVISVGSATQNNQRTLFSNFGRSVDILCPGAGDEEDSSRYNIVSTTNSSSFYATNLSDFLLDGDPGNSQDYAYLRLGGTSQSAAYASGAAALILEKYPEIDQKTLRQILIQSARPETSIMSGIIDLDVALGLAYMPPKANFSDLPIDARGKILLRGTASAKDFDHYSIDYSLGSNKPDALVSWINLYNSNHSVEDEILYEYDTRRHNDALLTLRLTVVDSSGHKSYDVKVIKVHNPFMADLSVTTELLNNKTIYSLEDIVNFTIKVRNINDETIASNKTAYAVQTSLKLPDNYSFDSLLNTNSLCSKQGQNLICDWFTLQSGYSKTRTLKLKYSGLNLDRSKPVNLGEATIKSNDTSPARKTIDPDDSNNSSLPLSFWLRPYTDLGLSLNVDKASYKAGDQVLLTIKASNNKLRQNSSIIASAYAVKTTIKLIPSVVPLNLANDSQCSFNASNFELVCNFYTVSATSIKDKVISLKLANSLLPGSYNIINSAVIESKTDIMTQKTLEFNNNDNLVTELNVRVVR